MSVSALYHRFVKLCKSWPKEPDKTTRDFAPHLHRQLIEWFPKGELSEVKDLNAIERQISSLERLNSDVIKRKYSDVNVAKLSTASGFTRKQIKETMSTDYIEKNEEMKKLQNVISHGLKDLREDLKFIAESKERMEKEKKQKLRKLP